MGSADADSPGTAHLRSFDLLATLVAVVRANGMVLFANSALEDALGTSRRVIEDSQFADCFTEPELLLTALAGARGNQFAALRYDAHLKRLNHDPIPVHVIVTQTEQPDEIIVELSQSEALVKSTMDNFDQWARQLQEHLRPVRPADDGDG